MGNRDQAIDSRLRNVQNIIRKKRLDALYVGAIKNVRYLSGFTGSSGFILITKDRVLFFTDFRYKEQSEAEVKGCETGIETGSRVLLLRRLVKSLGIKRLGFESSLSYEFYTLLKGLPVTLEPKRSIIENFRKVKDESEISAISSAVERAEAAFLKVKPFIKVGSKERAVSLRLEEQLKREGCKSLPFDIIIASGENSSKPHAQPTEKKIGKGDFVMIDWGGEAEGYYSDMTRTLLMAGDNLHEKIKIYMVVNKARQKAVAAVGAGVKTQDIDRAARETIKKAGYGEFFGHGTGHGVGLDVHEAPRVSWPKGDRVSDGFVFTIEPGIYVPKLGGVRIEDMLTLKGRKGRFLTSLSRELEIIK
ncbi:MAG TPA: Xaa-Pro peptidase family protein [Dissulfurispiraceae bacterium]|nr:Xaa-Pro peptidase family protein [Dissulfurispiraceae bacterium]